MRREHPGQTLDEVRACEIRGQSTGRDKCVGECAVNLLASSIGVNRIMLEPVAAEVLPDAAADHPTGAAELIGGGYGTILEGYYH